ncbi:MAG: ABC transporter ATP-binding protein [Thermoanaerobaculia bacterium]|nr:ABC transporter ATP-binding protein [Thermoanaerobaculia bacterium]
MSDRRSKVASNGSLIEMRAIRKVYDTGKHEVEALRGVDLTVRKQEFLSIVGPSGSGKSTLLNIIGCLDTPTDGSYRLDGEEVAGFDGDRLADVRNRKIGFIFQSFNLLPQITAYDNVELPLLFKGAGARKRRERVEALLSQVGLADRMDHKPTELSGGQMQRVAIARALACEPDLILADEPTGNLDSTSGADILHVFEELADAGNTVLVITHDHAIADRTERIVTLQDGEIVTDETR